VHAHTGVMSHLMAPRDARMLARCPVCVPAHAGNGVERRHGAAASASVERRRWRVGTGTIDGKDVARTMPISQCGVALDLYTTTIFIV